ncbi:unnamed protein product [Cylindrotheca closterium]|uniref:Uncharacterized protein n=1 Tax=Cylindrotheca closterium TaxID=2856 RepID=A0AAD2JNJ6_9STRA|nr:unnamed protein product [Cylindrotheca closterium]
MADNDSSNEDEAEEDIHNQNNPTFVNQLSNHYWTIHKLTIKDALQTDFIPSGHTDPSTLWTSSFTCPVDGKVYLASGDLPGDEYRVQKTDPDGETRWYYATRKSSRHAAAMQAIGNPNISTSSSSSSSGNSSSSSSETTQETSSSPPIVTPKQNLNTWYQRNHQLNLSDETFRTQKRSIAGSEAHSKAKGGVWWTATFFCPIDPGQEFKSMDMSTMKTAEVLDKIWFRKKSDAIQAAAAHALYIKQLEVAENNKARVGEEDHVGENTEAEGKRQEKGAIEKDQALATTDTIPTTTTEASSATRVPLMTYYQKHHKLNITNDDFVASMASFKGKSIGGNRWTATFLCPVTGERYDSKQLVSVSSPSQCHQDSDGIVWYKRKEDSIVAAALGAMDTLKFKESGVLEPRYCKEDPSESVLVDEESQTLDDNDTVESTTNTSTVISTSAGDDKFESSDVRQVEDEEDDDDDYIIEVVPQGYGFGSKSGMGNGTTTFDLIAETWLQSTNIQPTMDASKPRFDDFSKEKKDAIDRAIAWIEVQRETLDDDDGRRTHFDGNEAETNVKTANLLLESLASANHLLRLSDKPSGIEKAATSVLDYMWSTKSSRPNADSYASYIKCLEAESPSTLSKKVHDLYDAMESRKKYKGGRILPRPNTAVYNSLIQRLAETGTETSIKDIDSKIQPDEETFLSVLSSMKHPSNRTESNVVFDVEKAQKNLEQMKALSVQPTIQAYNAPLRWVGGLAASLSRPYSECAPWDAYESDFQKGFKVLLSDHPLLQEATNVQKWYSSIESGEFGKGIRPNIETMESQIQAWVRTTTRDGLEKACELGEGMINKGDHQLRLQSFHPIMAAWVYSGAGDGPEKVDYWLQRLQSAGLPVVKDGRYRSAPILARLSRQRQLLRDHDVHELASQTTTDFYQMAVESTDHLDKLIADHKQNESFFLEVDSFQLAIRGWKNVGDACARMGDLKGTDEALAAIEEVVRSFDDLVQYLYTSGGETATIQLLHLLNGAPQIYSGALSALKDFDSIHAARDMGDAKPKYLANHLISLERSIRRSEEFRLCTEEMITKANALNPESGPFENGVSLHYEDMFCFSSSTLNQPDVAAAWPAFFIEVTRALDEIKSEPGSSHEVTRICLLVAEVMKKQEMGKISNAKGHVMDVLKSIQQTSPELITLFHAVQRVYYPSRKKHAAGPSSNSQSRTAEMDSFSNRSTRKGLRRRKPMRSKTHQTKSSDVQQNAPQTRQQHAS